MKIPAGKWYNRGMEAILEPLIRSPKFLGYLDELNELRRREGTRDIGVSGGIWMRIKRGVY